MANCSVLESHQKATDKPRRRMKRSGGHSLVNRGLAIWIVRNCLLQLIKSRPTISYCGVKHSATGPKWYGQEPVAVKGGYSPQQHPTHCSDRRLGVYFLPPASAGKILNPGEIRL